MFLFLSLGWSVKPWKPSAFSVRTLKGHLFTFAQAIWTSLPLPYSPLKVHLSNEHFIQLMTVATSVLTFNPILVSALIRLPKGQWRNIGTKKLNNGKYLQGRFYVGLSPSITSVMAASALVVLLMIARCPLKITIRKHRKDADLLLKICGNYIATWGHTTRLRWRDEERTIARAHRSGVVLLLGLRVGGLVFHELSI